MKTPSTTLFDLLQSLSATEKRYLKINAASENSNYSVLMEAIMQQTEYDETALKKLLTTKNSIQNFAITKQYLLEWVLKIIERYRRKETADKVLEWIAAAKNLARKNLHKPARQILKKAKNLAKTNELFEELLLVLKTEKEILNIASSDFSTIAAIDKDLENCLFQIQNTHQLWSINTQLYLYQIRQRKDKHQHTDTLNKMHKLLQHPLMTDVSAATNLSSRMYFFQNRAAYAFSQQQPQIALENNQQFLLLLEQNPNYLKQFPERYLSTLHNLLIDSLMLRQYTILENGIEKLKQAPKNKAFRKIPNLESRTFRQRFLLELNYALSAHNYKKGVELLPELEKGLLQFEAQIQPQHSITLQYLAAYLLFKNQQYADVLNWTLPLLQYPKDTVLPEIFIYARWLNILAHLELGNDLLVLSLSPNLRRFILQQRPLFEIEKTLFKYIKKVIEAPNKKQIGTIKKSLSKQIAVFKEKEITFFRYLNLEDYGGQ